MSTKTGIEWTDATWNPIRGCSKVSPGCAHCYAERVAARFSGPGKPYEGLIDEHGHWNGQIKFVEDHLEDPLRWKRPRRIFVNSMSDLFHENLHDYEIEKVFMVMRQCHHHQFQVLTKRAERMFIWCSGRRIGGELLPIQNVWLGVSVENQKTAGCSMGANGMRCQRQ